MTTRREKIVLTFVFVSLYFITNRLVLILMFMIIFLYLWFAERLHSRPRPKIKIAQSPRVIQKNTKPLQVSGTTITRPRYDRIYHPSMDSHDIHQITPDSYLGNMPHVVLRSSTVKPIKTSSAKLKFTYDVKSKLDIENIDVTNARCLNSSASSFEKAAERTKRLIETLDKKRPKSDYSNTTTKRKKKSHIFSFQEEIIKENRKEVKECIPDEERHKKESKSSLALSKINRSNIKIQRVKKGFKNNEISSSYSSIQNSKDVSVKRKKGIEEDDHISKVPKRQLIDKTKENINEKSSNSFNTTNSPDTEMISTAAVIENDKATQSAQISENLEENKITSLSECSPDEVKPSTPKEKSNIPSYLHTMEEHERDMKKCKERLNHFLKALSSLDSKESEEKRKKNKEKS